MFKYYVLDPEKLQSSLKKLDINYRINEKKFSISDLLQIRDLLKKKTKGKQFYPNTFRALPDQIGSYPQEVK